MKIALLNFIGNNRKFLGEKIKTLFIAWLSVETVSQNRTGKENCQAEAPTVSPQNSLVRIQKCEQYFLLLLFDWSSELASSLRGHFLNEDNKHSWKFLLFSLTKLKLKFYV